MGHSKSGEITTVTKSLKDIGDEVSTLASEPEVDISVLKARKAAEDMKSQILDAEYKFRKAQGEPVGTRKEFIKARMYGVR